MPLGHIVDQMRKFRTAESKISGKKNWGYFLLRQWHCWLAAAAQRAPAATRPGVCAGGRCAVAGRGNRECRAAAAGPKKMADHFFFLPNDKAFRPSAALL